MKLIEFGKTTNLLVNGDVSQSARNFPTFGWVPDISNGSVGIPFGAFTQINRSGESDMLPLVGNFFFSPVSGDNDIMAKMISNIPDLPLKPPTFLDPKNMPGMVPGANMPASFIPSPLPPMGMPSIPGLPQLPNFPGIPSTPSGISMLPGIPMLPGMSCMQNPSSLGINFPEWFKKIFGSGSSGMPYLPGISEIVNLFASIIKEIEENLERHTHLVQTIDVSLFKNIIDIGEQTFDFTGCLRSGNGSDKAQIWIEPLDEYGKPINYKIGNTFYQHLWQSSEILNKSWQRFSINENSNKIDPALPTGNTLPKKTRKIKITLRVWKSFGHKHFAGAFDDLSLKMPVYKIPLELNEKLLEVDKATVMVGKTIYITPPGGSYIDVTYESSNPAVASVAYGRITGIKPGKTIIKIIDPMFKDAPNTVEVTVIPVQGTPVFTLQPSNQTIYEGDGVCFSALADGEQPITYYWWGSKDDVTWGPMLNILPYTGVDTENFSIISHTKSLNGYKFRCVAKNSIGETNSESATLTINPPPATAPVFSQHPSDKSIIEGKQTTFSVTAKGNPAPTYQWQYSIDGETWISIDNDTIYNGVFTNYLTISNAPISLNNYKYRCMATNSASSIYSNPATLEVTAVPPVAPPPPPPAPKEDSLIVKILIFILKLFNLYKENK